jgi:hypothetical protein
MGEPPVTLKKCLDFHSRRFSGIIRVQAKGYVSDLLVSFQK